MPAGYFKSNRIISNEQMQHVQESLAVYFKLPESERGPLVVNGGLEFIPFPRADVVPDALCRYCWSANLNTSTHCAKCGASLVHL